MVCIILQYKAHAKSRTDYLIENSFQRCGARIIYQLACHANQKDTQQTTRTTSELRFDHIIYIIMYNIPRANILVVLAVISLTVLADVQGNMENEYSLQKGINNHRQVKGETTTKIIANLRTERQLMTAATDGVNTDGYASHRHVGADDYCRFLKSIGKSCP
ncbi:hypothetical protein GUJ93_ZPchr0004g38811 [Zizania palustris]|uniref:Uncharacterized protein n=1 Tax=Zizania palustris TaxID=103762 RepID=A0A8J5S4X4_ZIZPA|nr:hypothetical protein GUJ93_ZPchr0004g38811 [Zizania palustris]